MKHVLLPLIGVALFIVIVGIFTQRVQNRSLNILPGKNQESRVEKESIKVGDTKVLVEVADTEEGRRQGLSGRTSLPKDEGMLFVFEEEDVRPTFWMKDMGFPIDIIWIDDGKVVQIDKNLEPEEAITPVEELKLYIPNQPIDYVLEVNSGFSERNDLEIGDNVDLSQIL